MSDDTVVHFTGTPGSKFEAKIELTTTAKFADHDKIRVVHYRDRERLPVNETIERAMSKVGQSGYNLFLNNCEHFATWCVTGQRRSGQVDGATGAGAAASAIGGATVLGTAGVSALGSVAGVSGAGIMSGLATAGSAVLGGAVAGLAVLGAAPGAASSLAMRRVLKDAPGLSEGERSARTVGRHVAPAAAVSAGGAGIAAVSALGTAGLSAAGISSGLAAVGAAVGGGMLAGTAVVVAAPAVAAAGVSYGAYRLVRRVHAFRAVPRPALPPADPSAHRVRPEGDEATSDDSEAA